MEIAITFRVYSGCRVRVRPDEKWRASSTNPFLLLNEREHHENCIYVLYGLPCTVLAVRRGGRRTGAATDAGGVDRNTRFEGQVRLSAHRFEARSSACRA